MKKSMIAQMKRAGVSVLAGILLSAVLTLLPAVLIDKEVLSADKGAGAMVFVVFLGSFAASILACRGQKEGKGRTALLCGGMMLAALVCLSAVVCLEELLSVKLIINTVAVFTGSILGCAICLNCNKRTGGRRKRYYAR